MYAKGLKRFLTIILGSLLLTSCANMQAMLDSEVQEQKPITVEQTLQVSIPLPENSKYLTDKTVIFGEGNKFTGILYLQHENPADETVSFYRKNMISNGWSEIGIVRSRFILINYEKRRSIRYYKSDKRFYLISQNLKSLLDQNHLHS